LPGVPSNSKALFCHGPSDSCFTYSATARDFGSARADCRSQKGELVMFKGAAKQLLVGARGSRAKPPRR
jgi:hypothetical protein